MHTDLLSVDPCDNLRWTLTTFSQQNAWSEGILRIMSDLSTYMYGIHAVARPCGWPKCKTGARQRKMRQDPLAAKPGRPSIYCSETCRMASQSRRRTLRTGLKKIEQDLAAGATNRTELLSWAKRLRWELEYLEFAMGTSPTVSSPRGAA